MCFEFEGELWLYDGRDPWHFVTVPVGVSETIRENTPGAPTGFGSVRVIATIGSTGGAPVEILRARPPPWLSQSG